jgi:non-homologous end joining protein Ku
MGIFSTPALSVIRDTIARTKIFAINNIVTFSCERIAERGEGKGT